MILLATDTSGKQGSIALARAADDLTLTNGSSDDVEILEVVALAGGTFSAQLVPEIAALLTKHGLSVRRRERLYSGLRARVVHWTARGVSGHQSLG